MFVLINQITFIYKYHICCKGPTVPTFQKIIMGLYPSHSGSKKCISEGLFHLHESVLIYKNNIIL